MRSLGLIVVLTSGIVLAPIAHRLLHRAMSVMSALHPVPWPE
jgi:hypothetical protein